MSKDADAIIGLYRRHADAWTKARGSRLVEAAWLDHFCGLMPQGGSALDVGCGSGVPIGRYLVERGFSVTGVDSAPEMIARFRANLPGQYARVEDMRSLNLGRRFDGLIAWDSFFHLTQDHQRSMFRVFRDHAAPHAVLLFTSGPVEGEAIGVLEGEPLYHASLANIEYRTLLEEIGFRVVAQVNEDPNCGGRTVWLSQLR